MGEVSEERPQGQFLVSRDRRIQALGGSGLPGDSTGLSFRHPELLS